LTTGSLGLAPQGFGGERGAAGDREVTGSNPPTLPRVVVRAVCAILVDNGWVWLTPPFAEHRTDG
jgi:hypothetical protein